MTRPLIPLGPFDLLRPIGRGGMAEVWQGVHRSQRLPVAVKLIMGAHARDQNYLSMWRNEVRAAASLNHPNIVLVFDHGEVGTRAETASEGKLVAGSPYLVMELATAGSLKHFTDADAPSLSWRGLRSLLLVLLDALAHAHSRGIIHRDLKPGNVIICGADDARPGLKLADFGLAHLDDDAREVGLGVTGTPAYMAPEQLWDRWRDYGPWTDLYALGCLAFQLSSGQLPFVGDELPAVLYAHLAHRVVEFKPRRATPPGFRNWLETLFARKQEDRFECAADAARALIGLGEAADEPADSRKVIGPPVSVVDSEDDLLTVVGVAMPEIGEDGEPVEDRPSTRRAGPTWVNPPANWRAEDRGASATHLAGAGLGLYGLREIPLVDRKEERDTLWSSLRAVAEHRNLRLALLHGPSGCGKSRLAEWLTERAQEVGAATLLRAIHGETTGPGEGLRGMVTRYLHCQGLEGDGVPKRLRDLLHAEGIEDEDEVAALSQIIDPVSGADLAERTFRIRFRSARERYLVVERLIRRAGARRPTVLWLDDVQWGLDSLGFIEHLLDQPSPPAVFVVMTVREEALAEREAELSSLERVLGAHPEISTRIQVGPLDGPDRAELIQGLLGLDGRLAAQVEARTAGNPLFAVQLVGDWVRRGLLMPADGGFRLLPGASVDLPDDVHMVWNERITRVLGSREDSDAHALELAAVLGQEVDSAEWGACCAIAGSPAPLDLLDALLEERLARAAELGPQMGWSFVHGMLRESLVRRAADGGRLVGHHRAAAAMLEARAKTQAGANERRATHLLASGDRREALPPLLAAAKERRRESAYEVAADLLSRRAEALDALSLPQTDVEWGEQWVEEAALARHRGNLDLAADNAARAENAASRATMTTAADPWRLVRAQAQLERGVTLRLKGDPEASTRLLQAAEESARKVGDRQLLADALRESADGLVRQGALDQADAHFREAEEQYAALETRVYGRADEGRAMCQRGLAAIARQRADHAAAQDHLAAARAAFQRSGSRWGVAVCLNDLAEIHRHGGDLGQAEALYREAVRSQEAMGSANVFITQINLALVLMAKSDHAKARPILEGALEAVVHQGRRAFEGAVHACLLPCTVAVDPKNPKAPPDWDAWNRHATAAAEILEETGMVDVDLAQTLEQAGDLASDRGAPDAAKVAWGLALAQWEALDRGAEATALRIRLDRS